MGLSGGEAQLFVGYLVLGVLCGYPVVNNELGQGRRTVACSYLVVVDEPGLR